MFTNLGVSMNPRPEGLGKTRGSDLRVLPRVSMNPRPEGLGKAGEIMAEFCRRSQ